MRALLKIAVLSCLALEAALIVALLLSPLGWTARLLAWLAANACAVAAAEAAFRIFHRLWFGFPCPMIPKLKFSRMYMEPHPYLPVVYKKNFPSQKRARANYELNRDKEYYFGEYMSNNFRHMDGPDGGRNIVVPKPSGQARVICVGASTTGNYIEFQGESFSYPLELEKCLRARLPGRDVVVHNCGHGGWTSAEILVDFMLNLVDAEPDVLVIYHAYNDLNPSLTPGFASDYSHARRNLGESWTLYKIGSMLPMIPLKSYNFALAKLFPYINPRHGVTQATSRGEPDLRADFAGTSTYARNIEHIITACKARGIKVVLSTFVHHLHDAVRDSGIHKKYRDGVMLENEAMRKLAEKHGLPIVDNFAMFPREDKYFVDTIHFSPEGMKVLAENIGGAVAPLL